jgi:cyclopropane fatty-acyl-phospholipid synthase-like methyltransferase
MDHGAKEAVGAVINATGRKVKRMLDLGGGSGAYSIAFARVIPGLKVELLDLGEIIPLTQENIQNAGLADRIATRIADVLHDPLGENFDLVLLSQISHAFSAKENRELFRRAYCALAPKGQMVVQDFILEPDKTAPRAATLFALNMLAGTRAGATYSEAEYASWLQDAGFKDVRRIRPGGLMIGVRR